MSRAVRGWALLLSAGGAMLVTGSGCFPPNFFAALASDVVTQIVTTAVDAALQAALQTGGG